MTWSKSDFVWLVHKGGYKWERGPSIEGPADWVLVTRLDPREAEFGVEKVYAPSQIFDLFQQLAATEPTRDATLEFANEYGRLGAPDPSDKVLFHDTKDLGIVATWSESLATWIRQIFMTRWALDLWDLLQRGEIPELKKRFDIRPDAIYFVGLPEIRKGTVSGCPSLSSRKLLASPEWNVPLFRRFRREENLGGPAMHFVTRVVNDGLFWHVSTCLDLEPETLTPELLPKPQSLRGALWLQFAKAVGQETTFRTCENCGKWLAISQGGYTKKRRFCSDSCRAQASRNRREGLAASSGQRSRRSPSSLAKTRRS